MGWTACSPTVSVVRKRQRQRYSQFFFTVDTMPLDRDHITTTYNWPDRGLITVYNNNANCVFFTWREQSYRLHAAALAKIGGQLSKSAYYGLECEKNIPVVYWIDKRRRGSLCLSEGIVEEKFVEKSRSLNQNRFFKSIKSSRSCISASLTLREKYSWIYHKFTIIYGRFQRQSQKCRCFNYMFISIFKSIL